MRSYAFLLLLVTLGFRTLAVAQPFDPEAATEAYLATVSAEDRERSDAYSEGGYWLPWCTTRDLGPQLSCTHGFEVPHEHFQTHSAEVCEEGLSREELA